MKKNSCLLVVLMLMSLYSYSQAPDALRYQASIQSESGEQLANEVLTFRITILLGDNKERVYSEFQEISTDEFGIVNLNIGEGNVISGIFSEIDWSMGKHYLRIEMDEDGGTDFRILSEVQLLSVPYALHAKSVDNIDDADADPENEIQQLSFEGDRLTISNGNSVTLPASSDTDPTNELQQLSIDGQTLTLSDGNTVEIPLGDDTDPENEIQLLTFEGDQLSISNGNSITIPASSDTDPTNELQQLSIEGQQLILSNGNSVELPLADDADTDPLNELQNLELVGNELTISAGNSVVLTDSDEQTLTVNGNTLSISGGNSVTLPTSGGDAIPDPSQPVPVKFRGGFIYAHPTDNATGITMGAFVDAGATSDSDGQANTSALVAANGTETNAASICANLSGFGFNDWYLPSRAELDAIFKQNYLIDNYELERYWSSTETAGNKAYAIDFMGGGLTDDTKNQPRNCRCIRKN